MLIKYSPKIEHLKCVALTRKEGLKLERSMVKLLPGTNEVTEDEWKAMRDNLAAEIKNGEISILAQSLKATNLKDLNSALAIKYVSECTNPETLTKWYREVTNEEVRLAITKRFQKLGLDLPEEEESTPTDDEKPLSVEEFEAGEKKSGTNAAKESDEKDSDKEKDSEESADSEFGDNDFDSDDKLENKSVAELRALCEERGIKTDGLKKTELLEVLSAEKE